MKKRLKTFLLPFITGMATITMFYMVLTFKTLSWPQFALVMSCIVWDALFLDANEEVFL